MQRIIILMGLIGFLAGCGLKGDLTLPEDNSASNQQVELNKLKKK